MCGTSFFANKGPTQFTDHSISNASKSPINKLHDSSRRVD